MHPNSSEYKKHLLRLKTVGLDVKFVRPTADVDSCQIRSLLQMERSAKSAAKRLNKGKLPHAQSMSSAITSSGSFKYDSSELWMKSHRGKPSVRRSVSCRRQLRSPARASVLPRPSVTDLETSAQLLDLQTNNSRKDSGSLAGQFGHRGGVTKTVNNANSVLSIEEENYNIHVTEETSSASVYDTQNFNAGSLDDLLNENAVAKGANALVKQATSRQTEIIDTSKLLEEGKIETQYEEPEDLPEEIEETDYKLIEKYEKTFAYARRLRALLNMHFKVMDRKSIETNFLLIKAHEHPTQTVNDRWRNVDLGSPYDSQIRQRKLIDDFRQTFMHKKAAKREEKIEAYPDWIRFYVRFKKDMAEKRWTDFVEYRQKMKKLSGGKVTVPKATDRYTPEFYDIWSTSLVVLVKPETIIQSMIDPVFAKLGLDARADFKFTIGCFVGDQRTGKSKVPGAPTDAQEVTMQVLCADLYKRNCTEIFVNDNRVEMFQAFPTYYGQKPTGDEEQTDKKGKQGKKAAENGKPAASNTESNALDKQSASQGSATEKQTSTNQSNMDCSSQLGTSQQARRRRRQSFTKSEPSDSFRHGDTATSRTQTTATGEEMLLEFDRSSPSVTNQNQSVHEFCLSDEYATQQTTWGTNTKSGQTEEEKKSC